MSNNRETVKVVVRSRPMNTQELTRCSKNIIGMDLDLSSVTISNPHGVEAASGATGPSGTKTFTFDSVYDHESSQKAVYQETAYPLVESVLQGYNGTIFAYGQTGCGKTHTMQGPSGDPGVIPQSFDHVFDHIKATTGAEFLVRASYIEIYNEQVRDLLGKDPRKKLDIKEDPSRGVYVKGATQEVVDNASAIAGVMEKGFTNRSVGATEMNKESSRSHSIFTMIIECSEDDEAGQQHFRAGKLNLVDLAGSERQSKTGATGDRLKEGCKINLSLSALGNVISSLVDGGRHIPYRDSKLTRLLQDSLGGNTRTVMVAAISPADYNYDETLSTLRYANRAKNIKNKPKINEDPKDALLRQYKEEIENLRLMLEQARGAGGALEGMPAPSLPTGSGQGASLQAQQAELQGMIQAQQQAAMQAATSATGAGATHGNRPSAPPPAQQAEARSAPPPAEASPQGAGQSQPETENGAGNGASPASERGSSGSHAPEQEASEPAKPQAEQEQAPRTVTKTVVKEVVREVPVYKEVYKEVPREEGAVPEDLSRRHEAQKRALQGLTEAVTEQRNSLGQRLEHTEAQALRSKAEADALAERLAALQSMVISSAGSLQKKQKKRKGGKEEEDPEVVLARQQDEYRRTQHKLRQQRKREARLKKEKERMEAERQQAEGVYKTAQEELESKYRAAKHQLKKLSGKHEAVLEELEDTRREAAQEKEQLLDAIREQNREVRLFEQLANMFLTPSELGKVWERAEWDEDRDVWLLPRIRPRKDFTPLQLPDLGTPTLGGGGGRSPAQGGACVEDGDSTRSAQMPSRAQRRRQGQPGSAGREPAGRPPLSAGSSRHAQESRGAATGPSYPGASPRGGSGVSSTNSRDHRGGSASRAPSRARRSREARGESRKERSGSGRRSRNGVGPSGDDARGEEEEEGDDEDEKDEEDEEDEESAALEAGPETEEQQQARKERRRARRKEREEKRRRKEAKRRRKGAAAAAEAGGGNAGAADLPALSPSAGEGSEGGLGQSAFQVTATSDFGALDAQRDEMEGEARATGRPGTRGRSGRGSGGQGSRGRGGDLSPVTEADSGMRPPLAPTADGSPPAEGGNGEEAPTTRSRQRKKTRRGRRKEESGEREGGGEQGEESEEARRRRRKERHRQKKHAKRREQDAAEAGEGAETAEQQL